MIEGLEKRIILYCDSLISLYLAYLLKIKNPDVHVTIVDKNKKKPKYLLTDEESLKKTQLLSLIDLKLVIKNTYKQIKISNVNNKQLNIKLKAKLLDYEKIHRFLYSSCLSQNVEFLDYSLISVNENTIILNNNETNEKKELSYYKLIFVDEIVEDFFIKDIKFTQKEFISLIIDTKTNSQEINFKILNSNEKTFIFEQPIDEYKKKVILFSKNKNKNKIIEDYYKDKEYKILSKENITIKTIDQSERFYKNIFFLGFSGGIYNHINVDDIYLSLLNAEIVSNLITKKIKYKKDIKNYEKEISFLTKEAETSKKIIDFLLSKTSAELDTIFIKLNDANIFENINVSSPRKEIKKLILKPKYLFLLKDLLFN